MSTEQSLLLEAIGNSPKMRVLDFLIENSIFDYSKSEIASNVGMSRTTLNPIIKDFLNFDFILPTREIGRATLYKLNLENLIIKQLIKFDDILTKKFIEQDEKSIALA